MLAGEDSQYYLLSNPMSHRIVTLGYISTDLILELYSLYKRIGGAIRGVLIPSCE